MSEKGGPRSDRHGNQPGGGGSQPGGGGKHPGGGGKQPGSGERPFQPQPDRHGNQPGFQPVTNQPLLVLDANIEQVLDDAALRKLAVIQITFARDVTAANTRAYDSVLRLLETPQ
jgi:hypothetical protein